MELFHAINEWAKAPVTPAAVGYHIKFSTGGSSEVMDKKSRELSMELQ